MFCRRVNPFLLVPFFLVVLSSSVFAQPGARLQVCNRGKVPVEVAIAASDGGLDVFNHWVVNGTTIAPSRCALVYDKVGIDDLGPDADTNAPPGEALVGFGFKNATGRFVSLRATSVPDFGVYVMKDLVDVALRGKTQIDVLSRDSRTLCVDPVTTPSYKTEGSKLPAASECASWRLAGVSRFVPLTTSYYFYPNPANCDAIGNFSQGCVNGNYLLNITANPATGEVAVTGDEGGSENSPAFRSTPAEKARLEAFKKALRDAIKDAREQEAKRKAAAEPINAAAAANKEFEARRDKIDYAAEHARNIGRIRQLTEFTPDWLKTPEPLYIRGTVSRVEPPSGPRGLARFYFKESPDGAFIACVTPTFFPNLQQYVGERVEVRGRVAQSNCGAKVADVRIANPSVIFEMDKQPPADEAILPGMAPVSPPGNTSGAASAAAPTPAVRDRNERVDAAQRPRNDLPQSPAPASRSSTVASTPRAPAPSSAPAAPSITAIPVGTQLLVALSDGIDLLHARDGDTLQGQLAAPAPLRDGSGVVPQGASVVIRFSRVSLLNPPGFSSLNLMVQSVTVDGRVLPVTATTNANLAPPTMTSNPNLVYPAGKKLVFTVAAGPAATGTRR